jgi:hypothetical protein
MGLPSLRARYWPQKVHLVFSAKGMKTNKKVDRTMGKTNSHKASGGGFGLLLFKPPKYSHKTSITTIDNSQIKLTDMKVLLSIVLEIQRPNPYIGFR